jgi:hypothetical protein
VPKIKASPSHQTSQTNFTTKTIMRPGTIFCPRHAGSTITDFFGIFVLYCCPVVFNSSILNSSFARTVIFMPIRLFF